MLKILLLVAMMLSFSIAVSAVEIDQDKATVSNQVPPPIEVGWWF